VCALIFSVPCMWQYSLAFTFLGNTTPIKKIFLSYINHGQGKLMPYCSQYCPCRDKKKLYFSWCFVAQEGQSTYSAVWGMSLSQAVSITLSKFVMRLQVILMCSRNYCTCLCLLGKHESSRKDFYALHHPRWPRQVHTIL